ncbi:MAG: hypothetical protein LBP70_03890 [Mycoplasmataceae bacterium]|nr:hypothetical protein [Mycoplasmataceae bacterium]
MKRHDKNSGIVDLAKVGVARPKPKYATVEMLYDLKSQVDYKIECVISRLDKLENLIIKLSKKIA